MSQLAGPLQGYHDYLLDFPKPLLHDLVQGRVLPIVGAGLSRNAVVPPNAKMPLWDDLGRELAAEMPGYPYSGALDAISAYSHEYSRTKLVERLSELLLVDKASPGDAHKAFCSLPFTLVCTTNFDFLLERQYANGPRYCRPVIDEDQLSIGVRDSDLLLLKIHGDLHHPQRLVVTEDDYDRFVEAYPLLSTYLANLLISRTPLLVGYSLDDPDFRQIWQVVSDRLGRLRRPAYAIMVDAKENEIARYARRGVRVVNLPGTRDRYGSILSAVCEQLRLYWSRELIPASQVTEEEPLKELVLPPDATSRLCFFAVPLPILSLYREYVFPVAERYGFVPISARDVVSPGENLVAKIEALIGRSAIAVVEPTGRLSGVEVGLALDRLGADRVLLITEPEAAVPDVAARVRQIVRPASAFPDFEGFVAEVEKWFAEIAQVIGPQWQSEPKRLLDLGEHRAAVTSALTLLEVRLRKKIATSLAAPPRTTGIVQLLDDAMKMQLVDVATYHQVRDWVKVRNDVAHHMSAVSPEQAQAIVNGVLRLIGRIEEANGQTTKSAKKRAKRN